MKQRRNYYESLAADYSTTRLVPEETARKLLEAAREFIARKQPSLPAISLDYPLSQIEEENREWWPTHCEALRRGRGDLLTGE